MVRKLISQTYSSDTLSMPPQTSFWTRVPEVSKILRSNSLNLFAEAQKVQSIIARAGPLVPFIPKSSFRKALKQINEFVEPFIERALCLSQQELDEETKSDEGYTFL